MSPLIQNIIRFAVIMAIQVLLLNTVELQNVTAVWGVSLFKPFFTMEIVDEDHYIIDVEHSAIFSNFMSLFGISILCI